MSAFKLISFLFPFIKEMVLGEKTVRDALKTNKMKVVVLVIIMLSFILNVYFLPKLIRISADYVRLERKYKALEGGEKKVSDVPTPKPAEQPPAVRQEPPKVEADSDKPTPPEPNPPTTPPNTAQQVPPSTPRKTPPAPTKAGNKLHAARVIGNSPEAVHHYERYQEWKKSFDEIKSREEKSEWATAPRRENYYYGK